MAVPAETGAVVPAGRGVDTPATVRRAPVREADFLAYDTARRELTFQLSASQELGRQVSFNESVQGTRTLTVPRGWRVRVKFVNRDSELPHSATVVPASSSIPEEVGAAAFPGAQTARLREGLLSGGSDEMTFVADHEGTFLLACGVFGHAQHGQWISFVVSRSARVPSYR